MSQLLRNFAAYVRKVSNPELHIVTGQELTNEESSISQASPKTAKSNMLDDVRGMGASCVGDPQPGRLAYFLDGIERTHVPCYFSMVPIVYGYVAAVIRARGDDKRMHTHKAALTGEALYYPRRLVGDTGFGDAGINICDTETGDKPLEEHPLVLREAARQAISKARGRLENELSRKWLEDFDGKDEWLMVDGSLGGTLGGNFQKYKSPHIVGVIKSHSTQYFPMSEQKKVLALKAGERSGLFQPLGCDGRAPVYSWYLRLYPNAGQDVYFGLIRVEMPPCDDSDSLADEISRWLLAERCPLSLPDSRWDRMLYPIRDCEQYLRSIAPTKTMQQAAMMR